MTVEQLVRDQLARATRDVPTGPDLEAAISTGRRRRRARRVALASVAVAAAVVVPLGVVLVPGHDSAQRPDPSRGADQPAPSVAAAPTDFVPGTSVDDSMAAVVAELLPALPAPDDVYPGDATTAGPIPDADFARAQDWQAAYTTDAGGFLVIMGSPEELGGWRCSDCDARQVAGGTVYHQTYSTDDPLTWWFGTYFVGDDGHFVNAFESVGAPDAQTASGRRQLSDDELETLVEDPRLTFD